MTWEFVDDDDSIFIFGVSYPFNSKEWDHFNNV